MCSTTKYFINGLILFIILILYRMVLLWFVFDSFSAKKVQKHIKTEDQVVYFIRTWNITWILHICGSPNTWGGYSDNLRSCRIRHFFAVFGTFLPNTGKYLAKSLSYPTNLLGIGWFSLSVLESAVEGFNRVGSDSGVGLASLEWGQAPKPPSFVALRATTQSTRWSLI